jgi:poly(A) polymerase
VAEHGTETVGLALTATAGEPQPVMGHEGWAALARFESGAEPVPVFPLRGADIASAGIPKGPRIGELLAAARQAWLAEGCRTDEAYARELRTRILATA